VIIVSMDRQSPAARRRSVWATFTANTTYCCDSDLL